jgi:NAD(P)-dependent dehydrogenase (short-subunit alcohol dehydrogenase family)
MQGELADRIALITGGSKGIGRAIAESFAQEGASVALVARHLDPLQAAVQHIEESGGHALPVLCDVTEAEQVSRLSAEVGEKLGPIDILVNNAGASGSHKFVDHPDALWEWMLEANLTSVYRVSKAVVPGMIARKWGRIINIGSTASKTGARYIAAYTASKHGALGLTRAMAVELNSYNITVNAICPGYADTPFTTDVIANIVAQTGKSEAEARQSLANFSPQKRLIMPEEVAAVAVMLASEAAQGITGQAISVDGGEVMI